MSSLLDVKPLGACVLFAMIALCGCGGQRTANEQVAQPVVTVEATSTVGKDESLPPKATDGNVVVAETEKTSPMVELFGAEQSAPFKELGRAINLRLARDAERCMRELGYDYSYEADRTWLVDAAIDPVPTNAGEAALLLADIEQLRLILASEESESVDDDAIGAENEKADFEETLIECITESPANVMHPLADQGAATFIELSKSANDAASISPAVIEADSRYHSCMAGAGYGSLDLELKGLYIELSLAWKLPLDEANELMNEIESKARRLEDVSQGCGYKDMITVRRQVNNEMMQEHFDDNPELSLWLGEVADMLDDYQSELAEIESGTSG